MADAIVDSDVLIDVLRGASGRSEALAQYALGEQLAVTTVSMFEILCGARTPRDRERVFQLVADFEVLELDTASATDAAHAWLETRAAGTPVDTGDLLIAGIARAAQLPLITRNLKDFGRISGLKLLEI